MNKSSSCIDLNNSTLKNSGFLILYLENEVKLWKKSNHTNFELRLHLSDNFPLNIIEDFCKKNKTHLKEEAEGYFIYGTRYKKTIYYPSSIGVELDVKKTTSCFPDNIPGTILSRQSEYWTYR